MDIRCLIHCLHTAFTNQTHGYFLSHFCTCADIALPKRHKVSSLFPTQSTGKRVRSDLLASKSAKLRPPHTMEFVLAKSRFFFLLLFLRARKSHISIATRFDKFVPPFFSSSYQHECWVRFANKGRSVQSFEVLIFINLSKEHYESTVIEAGKE